MQRAVRACDQQTVIGESFQRGLQPGDGLAITSERGPVHGLDGAHLLQVRLQPVPFDGSSRREPRRAHRGKVPGPRLGGVDPVLAVTVQDPQVGWLRGRSFASHDGLPSAKRRLLVKHRTRSRFARMIFGADGVTPRGYQDRADGEHTNRVACERTERSEGARRRQATLALLVAERLSRDAAAQLPGATPQDAKGAVLDASEQLQLIGLRLRQLVRPGKEDRRAEAQRLSADGVPQRAIAQALGCSDHTIRNYIRARG